MPTYYTATIVRYHRLKNSVNGTPRFDIVIRRDDGATYCHISNSNAAFCYVIGNPDMREGSHVKYTLTRGGHIATMEPAA